MRLKGISVTASSDATRYQAKGVRLIAHQGTPRHSVRELNQVVSIIGSGESCDVILSSKRVAESHAAIVLLGSAAYLCDLDGTGGTQLNGKRVRWARMEGTDAVAIGPFTFVAEVESAPEYAVMEEPIFAVTGPADVGTINSIDPILVVGRDATCDVVISHESVAPRHCLVVWTRQGPVVRALSGRQATRLNGRPIQFGYINNGDSIGAGAYELRFEAGVGVATTRKSAPSEGLKYPSGVRIRSGSSAPPPLIAGSLPEPIFAIEQLWADEIEKGVRDSGSNGRQRATEPHEALREGNAEAAGMDSEEREDRASAATSVGLEERLEAKSEALRHRVAAAQSALDERARRYREKIQEERQRLDVKKAEIQRQAEALMAMARQKRAQNGDASPEASNAPVSASNDDWDDDATSAESDVIELCPGPSQIEDLLSGSIDLSDLTEFNARETERYLDHSLKGLDDASLQSLEERVSELLGMARTERKEIERGEAMVETLRFETERQRTILTRRQEKLAVREASLEERFRAYGQARERIRRERATLVARLRQMDADDATIRSRVAEGERLHQELVKEAEQIDLVQERLETRERELLHKLELERQRLQLRQHDLQRKVAQLAKAAREKRLAIEKEVTEQQAELEAREAELRARRLEIEEAARGELARTATELEHVLNVRLSDIESDLIARRAELDSNLRELSGGPAVSQPRGGKRRVDGPLRSIATELAAFSRARDAAGDSQGQLDALQLEIEAFSRSAMEEATEPAPASTEARRRTRRLSEALEAGVDAFEGGIRDGGTAQVNGAGTNGGPATDTDVAVAPPAASAILESAASGHEHMDSTD